MTNFLKEKYWLRLLNLQKKEVPKNMIIYGTWFFDKAFVRLEKRIQKVKETNLPNLKIGTIKNKKMFYGVAYGPTMAGELCHLAGVLGVKKIFLIGTCGCLDINNPTIMLPKIVIRDEGVSDWYLKKSVLPKADNNLLVGAKKFFQKNEINVGTEKIITVDNMLMETDSVLKKWNKAGIKAVDLETATIYSLSNYFKIKSLAILIKSENLITGEITDSKTKNTMRKLAIDCAINLV